MDQNPPAPSGPWKGCPPLPAAPNKGDITEKNMSNENTSAVAPVAAPGVELGQAFVLKAAVRLRPAGGRSSILFPKVENNKLTLHCLENDLGGHWTVLEKGTRCTLISAVEQTDTWTFAVERPTAIGFSTPEGMVLRRAAFDHLKAAEAGAQQGFLLKKEARAAAKITKGTTASKAAGAAAPNVAKVFALDVDTPPQVQQPEAAVAARVEPEVEEFDMLGDEAGDLPPEPEATVAAAEAAPSIVDVNDSTEAAEVNVEGDSLDDLLMS